MKKLITLCLLQAAIFNSQAQPKLNQASTSAKVSLSAVDCPEPTENQITRVCNSIYDKKEPTQKQALVINTRMIYGKCLAPFPA